MPTPLNHPTLEEIALAWQYAEQAFYTGNCTESLVTQIRCALLHSTIVTQQKSIPENDEWQQGMVYTRLLPHFTHKEASATPNFMHPLVLETLTFLRNWQTTKNENQRLDFLAEIVTYLPPTEQASLIQYLIDASLTMDWYPISSTLLRASALSLTHTHITQLFTRTMKFPAGLKRVEALIALAPHLPTEWVLQAWQVAQQSILDMMYRSGISTIACYLPNEQWQEAFATFLTIPDEYRRAIVLSDVVRHLTPGECEIVWENALQMGNIHAQAYLLNHLIPVLADNQRQKLSQQLLRLKNINILIYLSNKSRAWLPDTWFKRALQAIDTPNLYFYAEAFVILGASCTGEMQHKVWQAGIDAANTEVDPEDRVELLTKLLKYLDGDLRTEVFTRILADLRTFTPEGSSDALIDLGWVARDAEFAPIVEEIANIQPPNDQTHAISQIAHLLPDAYMAQGMELVRSHKEHMWYGRDCELLGVALAGWAKRDPDAAYVEWKANLHAFAELPRTALLTFIANMLPFALSLANSEPAQLAEGIYSAIHDIYTRDALFIA